MVSNIGRFNFILIDTAGMDESLTGKTDTEIRYQTELAIEESDIIIFVIDSRVGVLPVEKFFSKKLIKLNKPVILLLNKSEGNRRTCRFKRKRVSWF
jgi:GTP-binding protein